MIDENLRIVDLVPSPNNSKFKAVVTHTVKFLSNVNQLEFADRRKAELHINNLEKGIGLMGPAQEIWVITDKSLAPGEVVKIFKKTSAGWIRDRKTEKYARDMIREQEAERERQKEARDRALQAEIEAAQKSLDSIPDANEEDLVKTEEELTKALQKALSDNGIRMPISGWSTDPQPKKVMTASKVTLKVGGKEVGFASDYKVEYKSGPVNWERHPGQVTFEMKVGKVAPVANDQDISAFEKKIGIKK